MPFSIEDKHTIKVFRQNNGYGAVRLLKMFPNKPWSLNGSKTLTWKIDDRGSIERCPGSGWPRSVHVDAARWWRFCLKPGQQRPTNAEQSAWDSSSNTHFQEFGTKNYPQRFKTNSSLELFTVTRWPDVFYHWKPLTVNRLVDHVQNSRFSRMAAIAQEWHCTDLNTVGLLRRPFLRQTAFTNMKYSSIFHSRTLPQTIIVESVTTTSGFLRASAMLKHV